MKFLAGIALLIAATLPQRAIALTNEEISGYAICQAWSSAVIRSSVPFPEEWKVWAIMLQATAIASPLNDEWTPLKENPRYVRALEEVRVVLRREEPSARSPAYQDAYAACMDHVKRVQEKLR
jgi:hypothetical protein